MVEFEWRTRGLRRFGDYMFSLCVRNFRIEQVRFLDTCSKMAGINNNNFELFTFMNEFMLNDSDDDFFLSFIETIQY